MTRNVTCNGLGGSAIQNKGRRAATIINAIIIGVSISPVIKRDGGCCCAIPNISSNINGCGTTRATNTTISGTSLGFTTCNG